MMTANRINRSHQHKIITLVRFHLIIATVNKIFDHYIVSFRHLYVSINNNNVLNELKNKTRKHNTVWCGLL